MSPSRVFYCVAIVCFVIAAIPVSNPVPWVPIGLAFFALAHVYP